MQLRHHKVDDDDCELSLWMGGCQSCVINNHELEHPILKPFHSIVALANGLIDRGNCKLRGIQGWRAEGVTC